jgi:hypothetical protein
VPHVALLMIALRWRQHRQKGQGPHTASPGDRGQEHQGNPAQSMGFHQKLLAGTNRITIDTPCGNLAPSAALDGFVDAQDHWLLSWNKQTHQQPQQQATQFSTRPFGTTRARGDSSGTACRPSIPSLARERQRFVLREPGSLRSRAPSPIPTRAR